VSGVSSISLVRECDPEPEMHTAGTTFDLTKLGSIQIPNPIEKNIRPEVWDMVCKAPPLEDVPPEEVIALADKRQQARMNKQWNDSDQLRNDIAARGWMVQDSKDGYKLVKIG
jgi:cysteinyl-tRNA synthetase